MDRIPGLRQRRDLEVAARNAVAESTEYGAAAAAAKVVKMGVWYDKIPFPSPLCSGPRGFGPVTHVGRRRRRSRGIFAFEILPRRFLVNVILNSSSVSRPRSHLYIHM